jgi:hypothetical protein
MARAYHGEAPFRAPYAGIGSTTIVDASAELGCAPSHRLFDREASEEKMRVDAPSLRPLAELRRVAGVLVDPSHLAAREEADDVHSRPASITV